MANVIPAAFKQEILTGYLAVADGGRENQWKVALYTSAACLAWSVYANTNEVSASGTGYTTTGQVLAGRAVVVSGSDAYLDATDAAWTTATFSASHAIVYETAGGKIRAAFDFNGSKTVTNGTFTIQWNNTGGLFKLSS